MKKIKNQFCSRNLDFLLLKNLKIALQSTAGVAKLVDAPDLGSGAARRGGSSPSTRTKFHNIINFFLIIERLSVLLGPTVLSDVKIIYGASPIRPPNYSHNISC